MDGESSRQYGNSEIPSLPRQAFSLEYLKSITDNFSKDRIIGNGGSGTVYMGILPDGQVIAVKLLLSRLEVADRQFEMEGHSLQHRNIVRCLGCCSEKSERLLCYEFMPKGSLRKFISDESSGLPWDKRYKIIDGICCGLEYLHNLKNPIIHMDLKPENILLDDNLEPKIVDFGISRVISMGETHTVTKNNFGTIGYRAPEYLEKGEISKDLDIFSLGVIIIEIMTGHRNYTEMEFEEFVNHVTTNWINNRLKGDTSLEISCQQIRRCIQIGLLCVQPKILHRPPINDIINMLRQDETMLSCRTALYRSFESRLRLLNKRQSLENLQVLLGRHEDALQDRRRKLVAMLKNDDEGQIASLTSSYVEGSGQRTLIQNMIRNKIEKEMRTGGQLIGGLEPVQKNFRVPLEIVRDEHEIMKKIRKLGPGGEDLI